MIDKIISFKLIKETKGKECIGCVFRPKMGGCNLPNGYDCGKDYIYVENKKRKKQIMNKELEACPVCESNKIIEDNIFDTKNSNSFFNQCEDCGFYCLNKYWNKLPRKNKWLKYPENEPDQYKPIMILFELGKDNFRTQGHYSGNEFYDWCGDEMDLADIIAFQYIDPYKED